MADRRGRAKGAFLKGTFLKGAFLWIALSLLLMGSVLAIGISPIRKVVDFEPGKSQELSVKITNDGDRTIRAVMYARGDLAESIGIRDSLVVITPDEREKIARYVLTLPDDGLRPGVHKTDLVVMEFPEQFGTGKDTVVSTTASVVSELWVRVPYPGKYAEGTLAIGERNVGEDIPLVINLMNFGKEPIRSAKGTIRILGSTYEEIARMETGGISLAPQESGKLSASWFADVHPGKYHAIAEVEYDGKKFSIEQTFEVGKLFISIESITVRDFSLGQVAVLDISLNSEWNEPISNVYADLTVLGEDGSAYTSFRTASIDLPPLGGGILKAYWDTEGLEIGLYQLRVLLHYGEQVTERLIDTEVGIDAIRVALGPTAQVIAGKGVGREGLLGALVAVLILINIAWFVYFIWRKR